MTTAVEPVTATGVVTTTAYDLNVLLSAVAPFAEKEDWDTFVLRYIRIEASGGTICASATDRYHLGHARRPATGDLAPVYIRRDAVEEVIKRLDARAGFVGDASEEVRLKAANGRLDIEVGDHVIRPATKKVDTWPDLGKILAESPKGSHDADGPVYIGSHSLQILAEAIEGIGQSMVLTRWRMGGAKSPTVVECQDWFVALLQPYAGGGPLPGTPNGRVPYGVPTA